MQGPRPFDDPAKAARVEMNMTPMIDVVFQLIVVFLCSMKFRTLDEKMEATMPKDIGVRPIDLLAPKVETVVRVRLDRQSAASPTRVLLHGEPLGTAAEGEDLWARLEGRLAALRAKEPAIVGEIDAGAEVAHGEVMRALDGFLGAKVGSVRFRGTPMRKR